MTKKRDGDDNEDEEMYRESDLNTVTIHIDKLLEKSSNPPSKPIIFKVDDRLRKVNQEDYEPKIVSIGPIHQGKKQVKSMEQHKVRLLQELLAKRTDLTVENLIKEVRKVELNARKCYSSKSINLNNGDDFLLTMILDGCFIIQLMRHYYTKSEDPILESNTLIQIIHDLLLFENQLPYFVLTTLFDKTKTGNPSDKLQSLIVLLVEDIVPWFDESKMVHLDPKPNHLLGLVYGCISIKIPQEPNERQGENSSPREPNGRQGENSSANAEMTTVQNLTRCIRSGDSSKKTAVLDIHSASQLKEVAGIHLRSSKDNTITFACKYLRLPPLKVSHETESLLRNLMAYEQLHLGVNPKYVIDYVFFMQSLAKSTKDIEKLRYHGIIKNYLGCDEDILKMIGRLGTHFIRSPDYTYSDVFASVDKFCSNPCNRVMAILMQKYFKTPWSLIKFLAATALLAFAATQVGLAILSYRIKRAGAVQG